MQDLYSQITSLENLNEAYLDLYYSLELQSKVNKYSAINGKTIGDAEVVSAEMLKEIREELINNTELQPAQYMEVEKGGGETRGVYMLPVKERVKCQAIYRVLEPYFEETYSDNLYSFRSTKPSYYAGRSVRRLYLRNYKNKKLYVLKLDIHKYSDYHNHEYLYDVLRKHGIEDDVMALIRNSIRQPFFHEGAMQCLGTGTMQGSPLCSIYNNIYIGHIDKYLEEKVHFYRRVGDDLILIDKDKGKLEKLYAYIREEAEKAKLIIKEEKTTLTSLDKEFSFLGYRFKDGEVGLPSKTVRKILDSWKKTLRYKEEFTSGEKLHYLRNFFYNKENLDTDSKHKRFLDIVRAYNLVTDTAQIKELSGKFIDVLTVYFTGGTTHKKRVETKKLLDKYKFLSLTKVHFWYLTGKLKNYSEAKRSTDKLIKAEGLKFKG